MYRMGIRMKRYTPLSLSHNDFISIPSIYRITQIIQYKYTPSSVLGQKYSYYIPTLPLKLYVDIPQT